MNFRFRFIPLLITFIGYSQIQYKGKVVEKATKKAIEDVYILHKKTNSWTKTNKLGEFSISLPDWNSIEVFVKHLSYVNKTVILKKSRSNKIFIELKKQNLNLEKYTIQPVSKNNISKTKADQEKKITQLNPIVVSATQTKRQLSSLPLPVQIISKEQLKRTNSVRLSSILNEQTGLVTVPGHAGRREGIQMQGMHAKYTLILIDGMPLMGRMVGTLDLGRISVGNIKQIEIVKGASSGLYGNQALGGVINIITETPKEGFQKQINYRIGSFKTHDTSVNLDYKNEKSGITMFLNRYSSGGYRLRKDSYGKTVEPFANYTVQSTWKQKINDKFDLNLSARYYTQEQKDVRSKNLEGKGYINEWNAHLKLLFSQNNKWNHYLELYTTQYNANTHLKRQNADNPLKTNFTQLFIRPEFRTTFIPNKKYNFIVGGGLTHEYLDKSSLSENRQFDSPYVYFQCDAYPVEKLNVILGGRFDSHSVYQSQFSPKLSLRYPFSQVIAAKASFGYGYKAPSFNQLYLDFTNPAVGYTVLGYNVANEQLKKMQDDGEILRLLPVETQKKLKAESSISYNIGFDIKPLKELKFSVNFFRNNLTNLIDSRAIARKKNGMNVYGYYNVDEVYTQGVEVDSRWNIKPNLSLMYGYQLLFAKDKSAESAFEKGMFYRKTPSSPLIKLSEKNYFGLLNRSRHTANFRLFYRIPKWDADANIRCSYRSKYGIFETNGNGYLDDYDDFVSPYVIWNIALNKFFYKKYRLSVGVDNLLGYTDTRISNIPGRIIYAKFNINL